ncbi:MAG: ACP S-malonyltransferase [Firmicutes bacterium]|nr:ACP S-malonyltransferase [Bacillota bacterium]
MKKYALMFPGQGAQFVGMGQSFADNDLDSNQIYLKATKNLGSDMKQLCFEENDLMNRTEYAQKAIFVTSAAIYEAFRNKVGILPSALIGFSLGEYTAMYASGMICFENMLKLIDARSKWMEEATIAHPGGMAAIVGGELPDIEKFTKEVTEKIGYLQIANYNSPVQKVLSGSVEAIDYLENHYSQTGAKRFVRLNVSGAFHTPFMHEAAIRMREYFRTMKHKMPKIPIVSNAKATYLEDASAIENIREQMESPVHFEESIRFLIDSGIDLFIEIGPGKVLTGLVKKINPDVQTISINEYEDLYKLEGIL